MSRGMGLLGGTRPVSAGPTGPGDARCARGLDAGDGTMGGRSRTGSTDAELVPDEAEEFLRGGRAEVAVDVVDVPLRGGGAGGAGCLFELGEEHAQADGERSPAAGVAEVAGGGLEGGFEGLQGEQGRIGGLRGRQVES